MIVNLIGNNAIEFSKLDLGQTYIHRHANVEDTRVIYIKTANNEARSLPSGVWFEMDSDEKVRPIVITHVTAKLIDLE